ncbi:2558_t:CDS:2, partial [Acaulospora morrowiae]
MSGRAFRKAINKEYELASKRKNAVDSSEVLEEEESDHEPPKKNLFDLLNQDDDDVEDQNSEENEDKIQEKPPVVTVSTTPSKKKKKKKNKGASTKNVAEEPDKKSKTGKKVEEMSDTELERLIREVSDKFGSSSPNVSAEGGSAAASKSSSASPSIKFLTIDTRLLDADGEMRRMFSSGVVDREIRDRNYSRTIRKTTLAKPRQPWPPITKF